MDNTDQEVMFQIGVMEHPQTASRLKALADSVESYQKSMIASVASIGQGADSVKASLASLTQQLKQYRSEALATASEVRSAMSKVEAVATSRATQRPSVTPLDQALQASVARNSMSDQDFGPIGESAKQAAESIDNLHKTIESPVRFGDNLPDEIQKVVGDIVEVAHQEATKIQQAIDHALSSENGAASEQTQKLRQQYAQRMLASSQAYAEMASDVDRYTAKHGTLTEKIVSNVAIADKAIKSHRDAQKEAAEAIDRATVKALRSVVLGAKGFAELGLMSEQSAQKFMQSMAVIQGAFDIFEAGADVIEAFADGWRAVRKASDAAAAAQKVHAALQSAQFIQLRAYHALLLEEAAAANAAAIANTRLAASRSAGSVGSAGQTVSSIAQAVLPSASSSVASASTRALGTAAGQAASGAWIGLGTSAAVGAATGGTAGAGGVLGTGLGASVAGIVTTLAAFAAAAGALALVFYEIGEIATGYADKQKSLTSTIASSEVSLASGILRVTGAFEKNDSIAVRFAQSFSGSIDAVATSIPVFGDLIKRINLLGDIATLAASQAGTERAEKRLAKDRITNQAGFDRSEAIRSARSEKERADFSAFSQMARRESGPEGLAARIYGAQQSQEEFNRLRIGSDLAANRRTLESYNSGATGDPIAADQARSNIAQLETQTIYSAQSQQAIASAKEESKLQSEREIELRANAELLKQQALIAQMKEGLVGTEQELAAAEQSRKYWADQVIESLDRQRQIQNQSSSEKLSAERNLQEILKSQVDSQTAQIQALSQQYKNAASNFSKLGDIEKDFAKQAIEQARTQGASSLSDQQRDLLRQVGTEEANRFAQQADQDEAKRLGFDQTFGASINSQKAQLETTRSSLEAQLKTSYDVSVSMQFDSAAIVGQVTDQVGQLMKENNAALKSEIDQKLTEKLGQIQQKASMDLRAQKQGQKG